MHLERQYLWNLILPDYFTAALHCYYCLPLLLSILLSTLSLQISLFQHLKHSTRFALAVPTKFPLYDMGSPMFVVISTC